MTEAQSHSHQSESPPVQSRPIAPLDLLLTDATAVLGGTGEFWDLDGDQYHVVDGRAIGIRDGRIAWIGPTSEARHLTSRRTLDARGKMAVPGLVNTHNHLFQNLVKGLGDEMYLLPWVEAIILTTSEEMRPEDVYTAALLGCVEALKSGCTSLLDFMFGLPDPEYHRAVLRAFRDSGLRGFLGRAIRDLNPDSGYRDPWYLPLDEVFDQMRELAAEFPSELPVPSVFPAPGTVRTVTTQGLVRIAEYADAEGAQITIHMGEYVEERDLAIDRWGMNAFAKCEEIGFLSPRVVAAHCVQVDEAEMEIMARTGVQVSYNPVSNCYLGNGIAPVVRMLEHGIDVSLATDGGACGNTQDMLEALRFGAVLAKTQQRDPRALNARDMLRLATMGGAKALGLSEHLGALEVGRHADLFLLDQWHVKTVPVHDPISSIVYGATQANVDTVLVNGEIVIQDGVSTRVDEGSLMREAQARADEVSRRAGTRRLTQGRRFTPFGADQRGDSQGRRDAF
ncbi:amidohydrolase [Actinopolymorpha sp. B11F2]|uniref:amidohydrolase n=1 Tax=Actinopolymorpha sp. B11F2 TaxID=3160862 RepID=UPI0032E4BA22